jgi:MoaA/NifB/PqqE/SkfB family radical SAM enzyme
MTDFNGCQIPSLPRMAEGRIADDTQPIIPRLKRSLAMPWNYYVKRGLKYVYHLIIKQTEKGTAIPKAVEFSIGETVKVRSWEEVQATLDPFKELKGCAFLPEMQQYCGTTQRVLQVMERFLDERDYKVKKVRDIILLEGVICRGTPVFGRCDRCCHLFWRAEWLEKATA